MSPAEQFDLAQPPYHWIFLWYPQKFGTFPFGDPHPLVWPRVWPSLIQVGDSKISLKNKVPHISLIKKRNKLKIFSQFSTQISDGYTPGHMGPLMEKYQKFLLFCFMEKSYLTSNLRICEYFLRRIFWFLFNAILFKLIITSFERLTRRSLLLRTVANWFTLFQLFTSANTFCHSLWLIIFVFARSPSVYVNDTERSYENEPDDLIQKRIRRSFLAHMSQLILKIIHFCAQILSLKCCFHK